MVVRNGYLLLLCLSNLYFYRYLFYPVSYTHLDVYKRQTIYATVESFDSCTSFNFMVLVLVMAPVPIISKVFPFKMEEESMMTLDRIMANMQMEEREIIMDKMVAASRDILGTIADMGYLDEYETPLTPMEERGYYDEEGNLDIDAVEADKMCIRDRPLSVCVVRT